MRKDCFYHTTPAMMSPISFENMDSCEIKLVAKKSNQCMTCSQNIACIKGMECA
ncbi:unnamed protein product, partial [Vitis vinifera]